MLPSATDISPTKGLNLDERCALKHYMGKSVRDAIDLLAENPLYYGQDLMWMGWLAFEYYLPALTEYLRSKDATADSDSLRMVVSTLSFRIDDDSVELELARGSAAIKEVVAYCHECFDKFEVDEVIDSTLWAELQNLRRKLNAKASNTNQADCGSY